MITIKNKQFNYWNTAKRNSTNYFESNIIIVFVASFPEVSVMVISMS